MNKHYKHSSHSTHRSTVGRKVTNTVTTAVLVGIATLVALGIVFHVRAVPVLTGSMRPTYGPGTLVFTSEIQSTNLKTGQVIAFRPPVGFNTPDNRPVMHRIVKTQTQGSDLLIWTRGDANPSNDPWTLHMAPQKVHKVFFALPYVGRIAAAATSVSSQVAALSAGGLLLIGLAIILWPRKRPSSHCVDCGDKDQVVHPHDLRTPLTSVQASLEILLDNVDRLDPVQANMVRIAQRNTIRLTETIEDMLVRSGIEQRGTHLISQR